jgi:hypothetical protein
VGKPNPEVELPLFERLRESRRQTTSMSLPLAVHYRLDRLARLAGDVNASRAEIIAMLIAAAELDAAELERRVLAYRKLTVGDVIPAGDARNDDDSVVVPLGRPGRPKAAPRAGP